MLNLTELREAVVAMSEWQTARLSRSIVDGDDRLVLVLEKGKLKLNILLCVSRDFGRISVLNDLPGTPQNLKQFAQFLKSHFDGGRLRSIKVEENDRIVYFNLENREEQWSIVFQLLGARSNIFLLNEERIVELSLRPFSKTRSDLKRGASWVRTSRNSADSGEDRFKKIKGLAYLEAVEAHYLSKEQEASDSALVQKLKVVFRKERASIERKTKKLLAEKVAGEQSSAIRRKGELLKAILNKISKGQKLAEGKDPKTGEVISIELDPKMSPSENLEKYFKKHKKLERQTMRAHQELGANAVRLEEFEALELEFSLLEEKSDPEALLNFSKKPIVARHLNRFFPPSKEQKKQATTEFRIGKRVLPTRLVPKRYKSSAGLEIWVGKNDEGNDILTTKLSRGRDLFFHLDASPGSHVVLRAEGSKTPPQEAILEASELAVHFSKQRNVAKASVHVAHCKDITKPAGAKHGLVHVHRGKSLVLKRDPKRLDKILSERIKD